MKMQIPMFQRCNLEHCEQSIFFSILELMQICVKAELFLKVRYSSSLHFMSIAPILGQLLIVNRFKFFNSRVFAMLIYPYPIFYNPVTPESVKVFIFEYFLTILLNSLSTHETSSNIISSNLSSLNLRCLSFNPSKCDILITESGSLFFYF